MAKFDWREIRAQYDAGLSRSQCQARYGFSNGAWNRAVERGEIIPRPRSSGSGAAKKRALIGKLIAEGLSYRQIAIRLGLTKATVAYHARRLDLPVDEKASRRYDWRAVQAAYDSGLSVRQCAQRFGFCIASWNAAVKRGAVIPRPREMPLEALLVKGRGATGRGHLKQRLLKARLKKNRCERCGITEWRGRPLSMQLHHRNGDGLDNRLENLEFLCANCHSQTEHWGGRNGHRRSPNLVAGGSAEPPEVEAADPSPPAING